MKVCIVSVESRAAIGGLAAYNRHLACGLAAAGVGVTAASWFDRDIPGPLDYAAGKAGTGRTIDDLPARLVGPAVGTHFILRELDHLTARRPLRPLAVRLFDLAFGRSVRAAVPPGIDVVHYVGTGWELLGFTALAAARRRGAAFTVLPAVHPGSWGDGPMDVDLYRRADAVFVLSDYEGDHLAGLGVARGSIVKTPLAPAAPPSGNAQRFRQRHGLADRPIVLFVARKLRAKGFHATCEAMESVLRAVPDVCLVTIGPDGDTPYPLVPANACLDLGPTDDATKADALAACDVFCMPSVADSFGIVYVEAWNYGKPVIGGPAPAVRELVRDGIGGYTVEQRPLAVAEALVRVLTDSALRDQLGRSGWDLQAREYDWAKTTAVHLDAFRHLRPRAAGPNSLQRMDLDAG